MWKISPAPRILKAFFVNLFSHPTNFHKNVWDAVKSLKRKDVCQDNEMRQSMFNTKYYLTNELLVDSEGSREMLGKELEIRDFQKKSSQDQRKSTVTQKLKNK